MLQKYALSLVEVLGGIEMNRWTGKEDDFHEFVGLLEYLFVPSMTGVSK